MNFYVCYIEEAGWMISSCTNIDYIWAVDELEAKSIYTKRFNFRKNKKGLHIELIQYRYAKRIYKKECRLIYSERYNSTTGTMVDDSSYRSVDVCYCNNCKKEIEANWRYCKHCDSEMED